MIEIIPGFPDNTVAVKAIGHVTKRDYVEVLTPAVDDALKRHDRVRVYYEIGPEYTGFDASAAWEDFALGIGRLAHWDRIALVTDVDWIRHAVGAFRFLMPRQLRIFEVSQSEEARNWILSE